jgi:predicted lipid carrier protein YhbT
MTDATADFFESLRRRSPEPLLGHTRGVLRVDLEGGGRTERWLVSCDHGELTVSRRGGRSDCIVRARKQVFDQIAAGTLNAMAALLRGALAVEGDFTLLVRFQRLFPSPPRESP